MDLRAPHLLPALLLSSLLLAACTGDGDGDVGESSVSALADVLVTDSPADDLLFLRAEVESVAFERPGGSLTGNLLAGPVPVDLLNLDGVFEWLLSDLVPSGPVTAVRIGFDPSEFAALDKQGTPIAITPTSSVLRVEFPTEVMLDPEVYVRIEVDFDLEASLASTLSPTALDLTPVGSAVGSAGSGGIAIDEIKGRVVSTEPLAGTLVLDAFADGDLGTPLGSVTVEVPPTALLVGEDGSLFATQEDLFSALAPGVSLLEVHGSLSSGLLEATKVEVEDALGFGGLLVAEIRGRVIGHLPGTSLELQIQEIKMGGSVVLPILSGLGDPTAITVGIDPATAFFVDDSLTATESLLAVGQSVKVEFSAFSSEPFPALKVDIEDEHPEVDGIITDATGLPSSLVVHLQDGDPALLAGLVASTSTDVTVDLSSAFLKLKCEGSPSIPAADLFAELAVEIHGALSGTPLAPTIAATLVEVVPGQLTDAQVYTETPGSSFFTTVGGTLEDPFGGGIILGPLDVVIEPGCAFDGAADSEAAFFALTGLVTVKIEGVASGNPNEIRAFAVTSGN